jgi:predicted phage-related endonuclease
MQRGIDDEPVAAELYARRHGVTVTDSGLMVRTWDHGLEIGASPDGLIGDDGLIEIKSRGQATQLEHIARGVVPPDARIQIQAQLLVSGRDWCDYVSYCPLMPLWVVRITRDQDTIDCLFAAAETAEEQIRDLLASYDDRSPGDPVPARVEDAYI